MGENTTIQIKKDTKLKLDSLKISKRETYNDVIENLVEDTLELNEATMKEIQEALKEYENGQSYSLAEVKDQLGL
jgi:predicted transcriptional regulator